MQQINWKATVENNQFNEQHTNEEDSKKHNLLKITKLSQKHRLPKPASY